MRKFYSLIVFLLISTSCFAVDTKLGTAKLTENQLKNLAYLEKPEPFNGFSIRGNGDAIGVSDTVPTSEQKATALNFLNTISETLCQDYYVNAFDQKIFFGRIIEVMTAERWFILSKLGVGWSMQQLVDWPNFPGLKVYIDSLESDGTLTAEDVTNVKAVLLEQGIVLDDFTE